MKPYIRVFFKDTVFQRWADIPLPEGTSFQQFMGQVQFEGFICSSLFYIPLAEIKAAVFIQRSADAPQMDFTKASTLQ